ncbi:MAG: hypothetical protein V4692_12165, partial [Bdellovibrionota bacterium]
PTMEAYFNLAGGRFRGAMDKIVVENGEFAGRVEFDFDRRLENGSARGEIQTLVFDPKIQKLLVNGLLGPISGKGSVALKAGKLVEMSADLGLGKTDGQELRLERADFKARLQEAGSVAVEVRTPQLEFNKTSVTAAAMAPLFFEHQFAEDWITLKSANFDARILQGGGVSWSSGTAELEAGQIKLRSEGAMNLERKLFGWIEVDYPSIKRLRFAIGGTPDAPVLTDNSPALNQLRAKSNVDDSVLGLKNQ